MNKKSSLKIGKDLNLETLINQTKVSVVEFSAVWCGPCKMLAPILEKLAEENPDINFIKVDVDDPEAEICVSNHNVSSIPLMVFYVDGQKAGQLLGFKPEEEILKYIKTLLGK